MFGMGESRMADGKDENAGKLGQKINNGKFHNTENGIKCM